MLMNRPLEIPKVQFRKLITYWSIPTVKRQKKENKEELNQAEMFVATRNGLKGKTLDVEIQAVIVS
ncbi:hypothetical protein AHAS_Ahas12G0092800 [Arachis hypogaea]